MIWLPLLSFCRLFPTPEQGLNSFAQPLTDEEAQVRSEFQILFRHFSVIILIGSQWLDSYWKLEFSIIAAIFPLFPDDPGGMTVAVASSF
jgi:hypothetical protein